LRSIDYTDLLEREWPTDVIIGVPGAPEDSILCRGDRLVLAGEQKSGKSVLLAQMIRGLCLGTDFLGFPIPRPRRVLYIQAELREGRLKKRYLPWHIMAQSQDVQIPRGMFHVWSTNGPMYLTGYRQRMREADVGYHGLEMLYPEIEELQPDVVVLDPLASFHDSNENSNSEMKEFMDEIDKLKHHVNPERGGIAVVIAHHFRKAGFEEKRANMPLIDRLRGSSALAGWADSLLCLGLRDEPDHKYIEFVLRDTDTQPQRELTYNYQTKSFDWHDPRLIVEDWAREFINAQPGQRASSTEFCLAMKEKFPDMQWGRNWMTVAIAMKNRLINARVVREVRDGRFLWLQM
jgi:RecA-family ATPase